MPDRLDDIFSELAARARLTPDEKARIRAVLAAAVSDTRAAERTPLVSAVRGWSLALDRLTRVLRSAGRPAFAGLTIAALLAASGGVAYAAGGALPGETLYPVKVGVLEKIREAVALSPGAKADWETTRAELRLEEARELAELGRLDETARQEIDRRLKEHVERARRQIADLEAGGQAEAAAERGSNLEGSLRLHGRQLDGAAAKNAKRPSLVDRLADSAKTEAENTSARRQVIPGAAAGAANDAVAARRGKTAAERKVSAVRGFVDEDRAELGVDDAGHLDELMAKAEEEIRGGRDRLEAGLYADASASFNKAHDIASGVKDRLEKARKLMVGAEAKPVIRPASRPQAVPAIQRFDDQDQ